MNLSSHSIFNVFCYLITAKYTKQGGVYQQHFIINSSGGDGFRSKHQQILCLGRVYFPFRVSPVGS